MIKPMYYKDRVKEFSSLSNIIDEFDGFILHKTMKTLRDVLKYAYKINIKFISIDPDEETQQITLVINIDLPNGVWLRQKGEGATYSKEKLQFRFEIDSKHFRFLIKTDASTYVFFIRERYYTLSELIIYELLQIRSLIRNYRQSPNEFHYEFDAHNCIIVFFNHKQLPKLEE